MSLLDPAASADLASADLDDRFRRSLMTYFLNRVGDRTEAEDLTQQTFVRVLGADRADVANPAAFVFRVAANLLVDRSRDHARRARGRTVSLDDEKAAAAPSDTITPERVLLARDDVAQVLKALGDLSPKTRDIFMLFRFENMRQRDIASRMGMSQAAVEKQVTRATLHLLQARERLR